MTAIQKLHDRVVAWQKAGDEAYRHSSPRTRAVSHPVSWVTGAGGAVAGMVTGIGAQVWDDLSPRVETATSRKSGEHYQYVPLLKTASWVAKASAIGVGVAACWDIYALVSGAGTVGLPALAGWGAAAGLVATSAWAAWRGIKHGVFDGWVAGVAGAHVACAKIASIFHYTAPTTA